MNTIYDKTKIGDTEAPDQGKASVSNKDISTIPLSSLKKLQEELDATFPGTVLIPSREGGKIPKYAHKGGKYTSETFKGKGYKECGYGCLMILTGDIIVVDIDDRDTCDDMENVIDEFTKTVCCETAKGRHYYFLSTEYSKQIVMKDGARQMKQESGEAHPIDIKTQGGVISIPPSPNKSWLRPILEAEMLPIPHRFVEFYVKTTGRNVKKTTSSSYSSDTPSEVVDLVKLLSKDRANEYEDWMRLGWCLHNIDPTLNLGIWIDFSKQSSKYKEGEGECERQWSSMRNQGLGLGTLHMWAKQDSPYEYKVFLNNRVYTDIKGCNGSHNSVASIAHKLLRGKYVCATANGKLWYEFKGTLWQEDKEGIHVRHDLSTIVRDQFLLTMNKVSISMSVDDLQSNGTVNTNKQICETMLKTAVKLQDSGFKDSVLKEMREYFFDTDFVKRLDSNPDLLAFTNGVWELKEHRFRSAVPEDYLFLNVGFEYVAEKKTAVYEKALDYWKKLHPVHEQCEYVIKTIARQLQGDVGHNLFHVHAGFQGSAGNGKTTMFDILELCLGQYMRKFGVEMLTAKQRVETGKPMPDFQYWKGVRILYCTEPKQDDILNTGIMKDLTGGEKIMYRLLYSNDIVDFRPMFKMHIMCNDTPQVDGSDSGVKRRIRKIDYMSQFVGKDDVDESRNFYLRDDKFIHDMRNDPHIKMEFLRLLLDTYDHDYEYDMPEIVKKNSQMYLEENDGVFKFAQDYIIKDKDHYFTLKQVKDAFKNSDHFNNKIQTLKNDLQKLLKTVCEDSKRVNGKVERFVFPGYRLVSIVDMLD